VFAPRLNETVVRVNVKKIVGLLAIALLIFFVITNPTGAAGSLQSVGATLQGWAESITTFFTSLVGGGTTSPTA
jgi:hypothetical protein